MYLYKNNVFINEFIIYLVYKQANEIIIHFDLYDLL